MHIPAQQANLPHHQVPADELPGWDPSWSHLVSADTFDGSRTFHVMDTGPELDRLGCRPDGVILAVHGNPTWSYLWRTLAESSLSTARDWAASDEASHGRRSSARPRIWRIVAPDQVDMGFSERLEHAELPDARRPATFRTVDQRISDLDAVVSALGLDSGAEGSSRTAPIPLFTLGHDWGGVISLGWAAAHQHLVTGSATLNTAVNHPADEPLPAPLRAALAGPLLPGSTVATDAFLRVTLSLGHPKLAEDVKGAFRAPYRTADRRGGIGGFVADIPAGPKHTSHTTLQRIATGVADTSVPSLVLWGALDPVFLDRYQADLVNRIPHVHLHRFEQAGHLLAEDVDITEPLFTWAGEVLSQGGPLQDPAELAVSPRPAYRPLWSFLDEWRGSGEGEERALVDMTVREHGRPAEATWTKLADMVNAIAVGLRRSGVRPGDRVSMLVQPGRDLTAALYAVLRVGATAVVADAGLGIQGMTRAIRTARPDWIIGEVPGLTLARAQRWPGRRLSMATLATPLAAALKVETSIYRLAAEYSGHIYHPTPVHPDPSPDATAAILFTSGSTGPAKGVRYTHDRLSALTQLLRSAFGVVPGSSLLAGFAPFALLGPAIGATSVTPNMSVTEPATLTASAVAEATEAGQATMVFASPAALRNVVATGNQLSPAHRDILSRITLMLSAGAPVAPELMDAVLELMPAADFHSPYGMTEALLLADIDRQTLADAHHSVDSLTSEHSGYGVCVGRPVDGVRIAIAPLNDDGASGTELLEGADAPGWFGEVVISAAHMTAGYDRLWLTDHNSKRDFSGDRQWHRTHDVGRFDQAGMLWIEGRLQHVITTPAGPLGPGGPEAHIDTLDSVNRCAVVGVGPTGTQAIVAVIEPVQKLPAGLAPTEITDRVRAVAGVPVAAVLITPKVPVDIRHNSKIDRTRLAVWADHVLAGGKVTTP